VEHSANNPSGLDCQTCHFGEDFTMLDGRHGDGVVDVAFDVIWDPAAYDFETGACTSSCHVRGGSTPDVAWQEEELNLDCNACHLNPPLFHSTGPCNGCHLGINPEGTQLTPEAPHIDGKVDII